MSANTRKIIISAVALVMLGLVVWLVTANGRKPVETPVATAVAEENEAPAAAAPAEEAAAPAEEAAEETAGQDEPVVLVTVNGKEISTDDDYLSYLISYYMYIAENYGYDVSDATMLRTINWYSLLYTMENTLLRQKAAELGLDQFTDEEKAELEANGKAEWSTTVEEYAVDSGLITETSTDDEKAAARADVLADLLQQGYDEERFVSEYIDNEMDSIITDRVSAYLTNGKAVSDEEVEAYFEDLVKEDQETYENDVATYEFYTQYYGQSSYYMPEGYRGVLSILLKVDEALLNTWNDLAARLEEQQGQDETVAGEDEDETEITADADVTAVPEEAAPVSAEPAETAEPVTEEMVKAAEEAILQSVRPTVDEIMDKLAKGASFSDLIKEYGTDPGMESEQALAEGYPVHKDSILWDPAFTEAAMALEKIGDVSKPVVGQYGVHILQYLRDVPGGAIELTAEMKDEFRQTLMEELKSDALTTALDQWMLEANVVYTEAGEQWRMTEEELAEAEEDDYPEEDVDEAAEATPGP